MNIRTLAVPFSLLTLLCVAISPSLRAQTTTIFTTSTTIEATNTMYDGENLVITNGTVTVDGSHVFASVQTLSNAVLIFTNAASAGVQGLTADEGSKVYLGGGLTFNVAGTLLVTNGASVICEGTNTTTTNLAGQWVGAGVSIIAGAVNVASGASINADGQGYATGVNNGAGPGGGRGGAGGGSYGGIGSGPSGPIYGNATAPTDLGSAGWVNSQGGGAIKLTVTSNLVLNGSISANGAGSSDAGSGGSIYIITAGLTGGGAITANGVVRNCVGGGGRIAVYYTDGSGFTNYAGCAAAAGNSAGGNGTALFIDTSVPNNAIYVYHQMDYPQSSDLHFQSVFLATNATLTIGGASTLQVDDSLVLASNATVLCQATNITTTNAAGQWVGQGVTITASNVTVTTGAVISADGQGYANGAGPGGAKGSAGGGSYGGAGSGDAGPTYGNAFAPTDLGSAGWVGSPGGGAIQLTVTGALSVDGRISANGVSTADGGSGGSVYVITAELTGQGSITANGHAQTGVGGGGRIAIYYDDASGFAGFTNVTANPGSSAAQAGSVIFVDRTVTSGTALQVYQHLVYPPASALEYASLTLAPGASVTLGGASTLQVDGQLMVASNATLICAGANTTSTNSAGQWAGIGDTIAASNIYVAPGGAISAAGQGYASGSHGAGPGGGDGSLGGGSYGGAGSGPSGPTYGNALAPTDLGSAGWANAQGGGAIKFNVTGNLVVDGVISANGSGSTDAGSGGSLYIITGGLAGVGTISANGVARNCFGGGGRIAVYYDDASGFANFTNITANGGGGTAQAGSVVFVDRTVTSGTALQVYQRLVFPPGSTLEYESMALAPGASVTLGGGSTLQVDAQLMLASNATIFCASTNTSQQVSNEWAGAGVTISASNLTVAAGAAISADGQGYSTGNVDGAGPGGGTAGLGGGSYGGSGSGPTGALYGNPFAPVDLGSAGWIGSAGGGAIKLLVSGELLVDGSISANGGGGTDAGSGGSIYIITDALAGQGTIAANGVDRNEAGGGGRIAIYYDDATGFANFTNVTANAGGGAAQPGSVIFVDRTVQSGLAAQFYQHMEFATNTSPEFASLRIASDATLTMGGGSTLLVDGQLTLESNATVLCEGLNNTAEISNEWVGVGVTIASSNMIVAPGAVITADGQGYSTGVVNGAGPGGGRGGAGGGSYGGRGSGPSGPTYGNEFTPTDLGSAGWANSQAGGAIKLAVSGNLQMDGTITANGTGSSDAGSGGSVFIIAGTLAGAGNISANGVVRNCTGGGGRIAIYASDTNGFMVTSNVTANAGGTAGQNGTIVFSSQAAQWPPLASGTLHGVEPISWQALAAGLPTYSVTVTASSGTTSFVIGTVNGASSVNWDTTKVPDGVYQVTAVFTAPNGQFAGQLLRTVFVNNSLDWHEGTLTASDTWGTNAVHAVDQTIIIPSGVTLTIAPGAIVKFAPETGIIVETGGILDASGATAAAPIIFTSIADDSVGGDSNEDGNKTVPVPGDWNGITASGQFNSAMDVQVRYVIETETGTIASSQVWLGGVEYYITGNITVPTNVTLTIDPGAIIKFNLGLNMTIDAGGALIANGTVAQPIIFTSINDQTVGTSTNGVPTIPAAGDWDSIYLKGGNATFDHAMIRYGGGPDALNSGLISITVAGSVLSVSDSILSQGFYKGIQAEYGTANVTNCLITGCDRGIQPGLNGPTLVNVVNCTLDNNNIGIWAHGGVLNLYNTIISDSLTTGLEYCCGSSLAIVDHCDIWSAAGNNYSGSSDQTSINGNISVNPKFVNPSQGNFELNYGSTCIDAADGSVATLTDLTGAPRYNDPRTTVKTGVTNANGVYPDMGAYEFVETAPSDIDLIATAVAGPLLVTAGQTATVQWNDVNIGTGNATGPWHDTISLVPDGSGDPVVATVLVAQNTVLGPGQSLNASASVVVPGGTAGAYHWQVQVNSQGDVFEGTNWVNNTASETITATLQDPTLSISGGTVTNSFTAAGQSSVFEVVSSGGPFVLNVQAGSPGCALKLYVGAGYVPDPSHFDFQSSQFNSPTASLTIPGAGNTPGSRTYYVLVYAVYLNGSSVTYTLSATALNFALNSVSPTTIANSGPVTLQILGDQLATNDTYTLSGPGGIFTAVSVQSPDPTVAYAVFNLGGGAAGLYSLGVAQPAGLPLILSNAITAISVTSAGASGSLSLQLALPPVYRKGRAFSGTFTYRNAGEIDMPAPMLFLSSGAVAGLELSGDTSFLTSDIALIAASFDGPAGTLTPDEPWTVDFSAFCASGGGIPFSVNYLTADATNIVNYTALEAAVEPPGYCASTWAAIWTTFVAQGGPTWGSLITYVDSYATQMALAGAPGRFYVVKDVLTYAFAQLAAGGCVNGGSLKVTGIGAVANLDQGPHQNISSAASADPNDKFSTGIGVPEWVGSDDAITYIIQFANETNATASAQVVTITDPLSTNLDWSTLQLTSVAFNNAYLDIAPGVQIVSTNASVSTDPNPVSVTASLNPSNGVVTWVMQSINPVSGQLVTDPLAGFLPPDNAAGQGEGYVTFSIEPISGLATGSQITNQANIVFDVNAPILTPTTTNLLDITPPTSSVAKLPASSPQSFTVSWSGSDAGSGIESFDIYVSDNGAAWLPWLLDTTNTTATYSGLTGQNYAFYSVAYDEVGNEEASPVIPSATTTTAGAPPPVSINIASSVSGSLTLSWTQGVLLQATNLLGPWTSNTVASPYIVAPTNAQMYFKLLEN
jgi:hypothetical protein